MNLQQAVDSVTPWFKEKEHAILDRFASLSRAVNVGKGDYRSVFVPGSREDRVLLVAHADTVWLDNEDVNPVLVDGIFVSGNRHRGVNKKSKRPFVNGDGIGADDRAGIAAIWELKDLGHSILITNCEENGCLSSHFLMANQKRADFIQSHNFAVQFDRNGYNDLVFYGVGTNEFKAYCESETGYKIQIGSFTDIGVLCETMCGVNISIGYKNEHTPNELLNMRWWLRTLETSYKWLSKPNLPKFIH